MRQRGSAFGPHALFARPVRSLSYLWRRRELSELRDDRRNFAVTAQVSLALVTAPLTVHGCLT